MHIYQNYLRLIARYRDQVQCLKAKAANKNILLLSGILLIYMSGCNELVVKSATDVKWKIEKPAEAG